MPTIGWFEILIIVTIAIIVLGPKDFPIILKKIGGWIGSFRNYFREIQDNIVDVEDTINGEISLEDSSKNKKDIKKENE